MKSFIEPIGARMEARSVIWTSGWIWVTTCLTVAAMLTGVAWMSNVMSISLLAYVVDQQTGDFALDTYLLNLFFVLFTFVIVVTAASALSRMGRRLRQSALGTRRRLRASPTIIYLRGFEEDHRVIGAVGSTGFYTNELLSFRARAPLEEIIATELAPHGLLSAVAEPTAPRFFLALGARRKRLSELDWRSAVLHDISDASLIVLLVGATPGLLWELDAVIRRGRVNRVILLFGPDNDANLRSNWDTAAAIISRAGGPKLDTVGDPAAILAIHLDWTGPRCVMIGDRRDGHAYAAALSKALASAGMR